MRTIGLLFVLALCGCPTLEEVKPDGGTMAVTFCPSLPGVPACHPVADGTTPILIRVSGTVPSPATASLKAHLRASSGRFTNPTDASKPGEIDLDLAQESEAFATLIPTTQPGFVRVDTSLGTTTADSIFIPLVPADVGTPTITPNPVHLDPAGNTIALQATVLAQTGGHLSDGTTIAFVLSDEDPAGGYFQIFPAMTTLDANGGAQATLHADAKAKAVTVKATVTPPTVSGLATAASSTMTLTLSVPPQ